MKIVLLGLMFSDKSLEDAKKYSKSAVQMAPHLFQKRLTEGLLQCDVELKICSVPPIGSYPFNYKKLLLKERKYNNHIEIGYFNVPIVKYFFQKKKLIAFLKKELSCNKDVYVLIYSLYEPFMKVINVLKRKYPNLHTCLIQTDSVPGIDDMEKYMTKKAIRKGRRLVEMSQNIEKFIILTKHLHDALNIGASPYIVLDCICENSFEKVDVSSENKKICLYTGTTAEEFGLCELVDAFKLLPDAVLWICGTGNADSYIKSVAMQYPNIKHFGFLSQEELNKLRNECNFLINPRRPTGTYTKYSFPSKTAEYLISGKPCIMYKLEGLSSEYDAFLNYISEDDAMGIARELNTIFSQDYSALLKKGRRGMEFMRREKNAHTQAKRIISLLKN